MDAFDAGLLFIRLAVGLTMAAHGVNKLQHLDGTAGWFDSIGMRPGRLHARAAGGGEVLAGVFLAAGLLTSFAALGFVALMTVAWWTSHRDNGFFILKEGWEYVFVLGVVAVTIATVGPGEWSVDDALGIATDLDEFVGTAIALGGGLVAGGAFLATFFRPPRTDTG
ncbi:MAG: DoxX family protein [Actinomycetota bacterium]